MANVSLRVPTIHPMLGIEANGAVNHQPGFTAAAITASADRAVLDGALAMARTAIAVALDADARTRLLERAAAAGRRGSAAVSTSELAARRAQVLVDLGADPAVADGAGHTSGGSSAGRSTAPRSICAPS
jgi:hypothetical protein